MAFKSSARLLRAAVVLNQDFNTPAHVHTASRRKLTTTPGSGPNDCRFWFQQPFMRGLSGSATSDCWVLGPFGFQMPCTYK